MLKGVYNEINQKTSLWRILGVGWLKANDVNSATKQRNWSAKKRRKKKTIDFDTHLAKGLIFKTIHGYADTVCRVRYHRPLQFLKEL